MRANADAHAALRDAQLPTQTTFSGLPDPTMDRPLLPISPPSVGPGPLEAIRQIAAQHHMQLQLEATARTHLAAARSAQPALMPPYTAPNSRINDRAFAGGRPDNHLSLVDLPHSGPTSQVLLPFIQPPPIQGIYQPPHQPPVTWEGARPEAARGSADPSPRTTA
eukprot:808205-Alexandrium_andersonii.AAC.1